MNRLLILFIFILGLSEAKAQISFPNGNVVDTVINVDLAYNETRILFHTGIYKSTDYSYRKITDSLDPNWFVTACFNGECRNDLEQSGRFISDFGINDTTCFIAFHVESKNFNGKSTIRYEVVNTKDSADRAMLEVNVTYVGITGYQTFVSDELEVVTYPNPASEYIDISTGKSSDFNIKLINIQGKILLDENYKSTSHARINSSYFTKGIYLLQLQNGKNIYTRKIVLK